MRPVDSEASSDDDTRRDVSDGDARRDTPPDGDARRDTPPDGDTRRDLIRRVGAVLVLLVVLAGLLVGYGVQFAGSSAYPDTDELASDYPDHVGERVHLWTTVVAVRGGDETTTSPRRPPVVVGAGPLELAVVGLSAEGVRPGDRVQVYGELRPGRRITATETVVVTPRRHTSLYAVSVVGILLAAGWFVRHWRLDTRRLVVVPRAAGSETRGEATDETRGEATDETRGEATDTDTSGGV